MEWLLKFPNRDWDRDAACAGKPTDWWFPEAGEAWSPEARRAKEICAGCLVRVECFEWAQANGIEYGIFGGEGQDARYRMRSRRFTCPECGEVFEGNRGLCSDACRRVRRAWREREYRARKKERVA